MRSKAYKNRGIAGQDMMPGVAVSKNWLLNKVGLTVIKEDSFLVHNLQGSLVGRVETT